jgi:DNA-binding transcriptional ArsR family regulator
MVSSEEETYSTMFSSLRHPARRKILRMLHEKPLTFSEILEELKIPSSHLTYHLENLGELVVKQEDGKYKLSSFGEASVSMMKGAEDAPEAKKITFSAIPLKWKSLYAIFTIAIVLLSGFAYLQYSNYNHLSQEYTTINTELQNSQRQNQQLLSSTTSTDQAKTILENITQIDLTKYQTTLLSDTITPRTDLVGVVEEVLKYSLTTTESSLDIVLRFRNDHFSLYQLTVLAGIPAFTPMYLQPQNTDALQATRDIISRYQTVTNYPYLAQMSQLLASANETQGDQTLGNTKLRMTFTGGNAQIILMFTENNTDFAAKSIQLNFENNILNSLGDDYSLYTIGSTQVNTSQDQAIQIARDAAKTFTWKANGTTVSNFEVLQEPVSAVFYPHTRTDPLALVPYWYITLYLDKQYPGGVNMIAVGIWADTGQVANINALSS